MDEELRQYRAYLIDILRFLNEAYDKILITLAGGALALSMVFLSDVVTLDSVNNKGSLVVGWVAFVGSLACILGRILFGIEAYRTAIKQVDEGTIYDFRAGSIYAHLSRILHGSSAVLLIVGFLSMALFIYRNIGN